MLVVTTALPSRAVSAVAVAEVLLEVQEVMDMATLQMVRRVVIHLVVLVVVTQILIGPIHVSVVHV